MPFSSLLFLFGFLPVFLICYFLTPDRYRNLTALLGSMLFYSWGAPNFVGILLAISWVDFVISKQIYRNPTGSKARKNWVTVGILINLGVLCYFKYSNFIVAEINTIGQLLSNHEYLHWLPVVMPIGISFIIFEEISYLVDVYRGTSAPANKFSTYALFLFLFPHSIAGPIFRWRDLEKQLLDRKHSIDLIFDGLIRFLFGLGKKVLIADRMATIANIAFGQDPASLPPMYAWLGIIAYTLQIYFDFSGYSDMAIGIGSMLGFKFKENFNAPYIASSITDFWRRWHISLSNWMRDYLYISLGGNRGTVAATYRNLFIVFLASGLWHGANWTFIGWGAYHGALLVLDRLFVEKYVHSYLPKSLSTWITIFLVMMGWVLFRSDSISYAAGYYKQLFSIGDNSAYHITSISMGELLSNRGLATMAVAILICVGSYFPVIQIHMMNFICGGSIIYNPPRTLLRYGCALAIFVIASLSLVSAHFSPFIYFRF